MALSGIEAKVRSANNTIRNKEKINFISYADDFVITCDSPELLKEKVIPIVQESLKEVGLELSYEKTKITNIDKGFNFLGYNVRKYNGLMLIKPAKENIKIFLGDIRSTIKANYSAKTENLIQLLNPKIRGWSNYYSGVVSSKAYSYVDETIYKMLRAWMLKRHRNKSNSWINKKYFKKSGFSNWNFHAPTKDKNGEKVSLYLYKASTTPIRRHIKIRSTAHPYNPEFEEYFKFREGTNKKRKSKVSIDFQLDYKLLGDTCCLT